MSQKIPTSGPERENLREKGQFWTPDWVARGMVAYAVGGSAREIFDPAVGAGAFLSAAKDLGGQWGRSFVFKGREIDPDALLQARALGLSETDLAGVELRDFLFEPPPKGLEAIVANPPYIRHHRISAEAKKRLQEFSRSVLGRPLDGRTGLHVFFLLRALTLLAPGGRLAFITSADVCEGIFAGQLWEWIARHFRLEAIMTFAPDATPFPGVDTNALVFCIQNAEPREKFWWGRCLRAQTSQFFEWTASDWNFRGPDLELVERNLAEGLATGFSRPPLQKPHDGLTLGDFAQVRRGVATGANEFFFLTASQIEEWELPRHHFVPAIGRTRDVCGEEIDAATLEGLERAGRPTFLLSLDSTPEENFAPALQRYLSHGVDMGLPLRPLIATRRPWFKMETRAIPPFLFAYLGRRSARFVRNLSGAVPLTGFLCVYPRIDDAEICSQLWEVLRHPQTVENLAQVGKSYGSGAIKVEPRALERLPLPTEIVAQFGLQISRKTPLQLAFD